MRHTQKIWLALLMLKALSLSHAANPLEKIIHQETEKIQHHGQERAHDQARHHNQTSAHQGTSCREESRLRSVQGSMQTRMKFINKRPHEVRTYWLDYNGRRVFYKAIAPNGQYTQPTYKTHPWVVTDQKDNCIEIYVSNNRSSTVEIR